MYRCCDAVLVRDVLVAAGERYGLKRDRLHLVDVLGGKFYDRADAFVVPRIDDRRDQRDLDADRSEIFDRLELYVKQIADAAMFVVFLVRPVELKINAVLPGRFRRLAKLDVLGVANSVRRGENAVKTDLFCVSDRLEKVRCDGRLAAREKDDDLTARLERNGAVEDLLSCPRRSVRERNRPDSHP